MTNQSFAYRHTPGLSKEGNFEKKPCHADGGSIFCDLHSGIAR